MVELSPTSLLDPIVQNWARDAGLKTEEVSTIIGGDIIGGLAGIPLDMIFTEPASKVIQFLGGIVGIFVTPMVFKGQPRVQTDFVSIFSRMATAILSLGPQDVIAYQKVAGQFWEGVIQGRIDKIGYSVFRNPREFQGMLPQALAGPPAPLKGEQPSPPGTPKLEQPTYPPGPGIIHKL